MNKMAASKGDAHIAEYIRNIQLLHTYDGINIVVNIRRKVFLIYKAYTTTL